MRTCASASRTRATAAAMSSLAFCACAIRSSSCGELKPRHQSEDGHTVAGAAVPSAVPAVAPAPLPVAPPAAAVPAPPLGAPAVVLVVWVSVSRQASGGVIFGFL